VCVLLADVDVDHGAGEEPEHVSIVVYDECCQLAMLDVEMGLTASKKADLLMERLLLCARHDDERGDLRPLG
jgi:hypothetical protein